MRPVTKALALGLAACALTATAVFAAGPTFSVRCMQTAGPQILPKYGTYYFFLPEAQVKGYACSIPGRPCPIVSRDATTIVFKTPGETPDTMSIDLRNGAIQHKTHSGLEANYACRQIANPS
ncbi:MAG: hypothetical protein JNK07_07645 [Alphaproteobacteria bacterium]|nr:hypothetical protein [Alphaproteobacteria bacterium]